MRHWSEVSLDRRCGELQPCSRDSRCRQMSTELQEPADRWRRCSKGPYSPEQAETTVVMTTVRHTCWHSCFPQAGHLQQAAVALLSLLHVQVPAARPPQQALWLGHVEETHPAAVQQADGQICSAAAAELLPRQEPDGGGRSHGHLNHKQRRAPPPPPPAATPTFIKGT